MQKYYLIGSSSNKIIEDENKYLMDNEIFNIYLSNRSKKIALYNTKKDLLTGKISFYCSNKESKNISRDIIECDVSIGDPNKFVSDIKDNEQYYIRKDFTAKLFGFNRNIFYYYIKKECIDNVIKNKILEKKIFVNKLLSKIKNEENKNQIYLVSYIQNLNEDNIDHIDYTNYKSLEKIADTNFYCIIESFDFNNNCKMLNENINIQLKFIEITGKTKVKDFNYGNNYIPYELSRVIHDNKIKIRWCREGNYFNDSLLISENKNEYVIKGGRIPDYGNYYICPITKKYNDIVFI